MFAALTAAAWLDATLGLSVTVLILAFFWLTNHVSQHFIRIYALLAQHRQRLDKDREALKWLDPQYAMRCEKEESAAEDEAYVHACEAHFTGPCPHNTCKLPCSRATHGF